MKKKKITKEEEIFILSRLKNTDSYFGEAFNDAEINQMIINIKNDFPLLFNVLKVGNRNGIPCISNGNGTYFAGVLGRIVNTDVDQANNIRVEIDWYNKDGTTSCFRQRIIDINIIGEKEWNDKYQEMREKYIQLKSELDELRKDKYLNSKRITEIQNEINNL